jgi:7-cyano-7-deazaguanine synthase
MKRKSKQHALVLLSGGLDSSTCVHFYVAHGYAVDTMFVDYGQAAAKQERRSAAHIAKFFESTHREIKMREAVAKPQGVIRGRNALLWLVALAEWQIPAGVIALGIHAGTRYDDCSPVFVKAVQAVFDVYTEGVIVAAAPFVDWSKRDVWEYATTHQLPVGLTYSCQAGKQPPCGRCDSCKDRIALDAV